MHLDVGGITRLDADPEKVRQYEDDGYPAVIADQRHAYGVETLQEVEDHWLEHLGRTGTELWADGREATPYINRARWLYDCPECRTGGYAWDRNPYGCCLDCGLLTKIRWQPPLVRSAAIRLLAVRPIVNCNWDAQKGETVEDLERENRWMLNEPSVEKNGLVVPRGLSVPEALERYVELR